jgi:hypothetical protein
VSCFLGEGALGAEKPSRLAKQLGRQALRAGRLKLPQATTKCRVRVQLSDKTTALAILA